MLALVLKLGRFWMVVLTTVALTTASVTISWITVQVLDTGNCPNHMIYGLSAGIPLALTPGVSWMLVSALIEVWELRQRAEHLAMYDSLTQALMRHAFFTQCEGFYALARRQDHNFAIGFFDCDAFKQINDRIGHSGGDAVLVDLAGVVRGRLRQNDLFARLGGDEFIIALNDVDAPQALQIFNDIRMQVASRRVYYQEHEIAYSVSIGVGVAGPGHYPPLDQLVAEADQALYDAKRRGRNRVSLFPAPV